MARSNSNKLSKKELAKLNTASPLFAPPKSDKEQESEDQEAIQSNALTYATPEQIEQAARGIAATRRLAGGLSGLARSMTNQPGMRVLVDANIPSSMTDGRAIYIKPSFELGAVLEHDRKLCGEIDPETELQLCPSCRRLEDFSGKFYHEVGHISEGTFEPVPDAEKAEIVTRAIAERGAHAGTRAAKLIELFEREFGNTQSMTACKVISPYLGLLMNALEDARVNTAIASANPGMKRVFRARTREAFEVGINDEHGHFTWAERDEDTQSLIACYLLASGFENLLKFLAPNVQKLAFDFDLRAHLNKIPNAPSVHPVYSACFPVLERLRANGFCKRNDDPEDDDQPQMVLVAGMAGMPEDEDGDPVEGENQAGSGDETDETEPTSDGGQGNQVDDQADDQGDQGGSSDDQDDDQADDQGDQGGSSDDQDDDQDGDQGGSSDGQDGDQDDDQDDDQGGSSDDQADDQGGSSDGQGGDQDGDQDAQGGQDDGQGGSSDDESDVDEQAIGEDLAKLLGHESDGKVWHEGGDEQDQLMRAIDAQFDQFDSPSRNVLKVKVHEWNRGRTGEAPAWGKQSRYDYHPQVEVENKTINLALTHARIVFANNAAVRRDPGQLAGRIDSKVLATVPTGNVRVFKRTRFPNDRDYAIAMSLDCSGSTTGTRNNFIREIGLGTGRMLNRLPGVKFGMWGHTATMVGDGYSHAYVVDMVEIKSWTRPFGTEEERALQAMHAALDNLDGHTMEFLRKQVEAQRASNRIIFYLTDGEMPAANRHEETEVLVRELKICERLGIRVIGIGVQTDSPKQYGLDTIRVDSPDQLRYLVQEIGKRL